MMSQPFSFQTGEAVLKTVQAHLQHLQVPSQLPILRGRDDQPVLNDPYE